MPNRLFSSLFVALALAGVLGAGPLRMHGATQHATRAMPLAFPSPSQGIQPNVQQTGHTPFYWTLLSFTAQHTSGITAGPDGATWVTDQDGEDLIRIGMDGLINTFATSNFQAHYIANGSDGRLWMTGGMLNEDVAAMTVSGTFTPYASPSGDFPSGGSGLAVGPDENVWWAETSHIASVTPRGHIKEYRYPSGQTNNEYPAVTRGPDGRVWFTEMDGILGAIDTSTHKISEYHVSSGDCGLFRGLAAGGDGNIYATCGRSAYRVSTSGATLYAYRIPGGVPTATSSTMESADGNVWISLGDAYGLIHVYNQKGDIERVHSPLGEGFTSIASGSDGNMWGMDPDAVSIYLRNRLDVKPRHVSMKPNNTAEIYASYRDRGSSLKAVSANTNVATVTTGPQQDEFIITSVAKGTTSVVVSDTLGNFFVVPVKVN